LYQGSAVVSEQEKVMKKQDGKRWGDMRCGGGGRQEFLTPLSTKPSTVTCKMLSEELTFIIEKLQWTE